jgi:HD-GYP domain-containing protein (c-di-GMP phosphodiesterase class II)
MKSMTSSVAGVPGDEVVAVPIAVVAHLPRHPFPVFDARGALLARQANTRRDTQIAYVLEDDRAALVDMLRAELSALVAAPAIPELHRAWVLQALLIDSANTLYSPLLQSSTPLGLFATLDAVAQFLSKSSRAPAALMQIVDDEAVGFPAHALRTTFLALVLAHASGFRRGDQLAALGYGALCADLGLAGKPFSLLQSEEPTARDTLTLREHPRDSLAKLRRIGPTPQPAHDAVLWHHERWDGSGYPDGIAGEDLPFAARCVGLADRAALLIAARDRTRRASPATAFSDLSTARGQFDPTLQQTFVKLLRQYVP